MRSRKKIKIAMEFILLVLFLAGCGKVKEDGRDSGMDAAGDSIRNNASHVTEEMDRENAAVQEQIIVDPADLIEPEINPQSEEAEKGSARNEEETETANSQERQQNGGNLQIVFLGDSILDGYRDATGIDYLTGINCGAEIYNLAMGGTTAALTTYEKAEYENWSSRCLQGVVHAICGEIGPGIMEGHKAGEAFAACDFGKTDYFVIEYGMNDFLSGIPLNSEQEYYDEYTYVGALRVAVQRLREYFPGATVVLCSPNYAQFFSQDGTYLGDGNMINNGGGTLAEYYRVCGNVSKDMNTLFLNAYEGIGLDAYTADEYLEDGIHLSEKGRRKYAEKLSEIILEYEAVKNN